MSLSKDQYDSILLGYSRRQDRNRHELDRRRAEIYARIPEYRSLEESVPVMGMQALRRILSAASAAEEAPQPLRSAPSAAPASDFAARMADIAAAKRRLLVSNGYAADYLDPIYDCPDCRDTGYLGDRKCHCFRRQEISILYDQSHLSELAAAQNFDTLRESWYSGEDLIRFRKAAAAARAFTEEFGRVHRNLLFHGTVGTGKSFLSVCIAQKLLETRHSVIYFSAVGLFDHISALSFDYRNREQFTDFLSDLYGCDLLIIDDLGTEMTNAFISTQFFSLINERLLREKATVISTNLSHRELRDRYTDRVFSRIASRYESYEFSGTDIRLQKKILEKRGLSPV
ncbi:ATP-binding protein [Lachnoclostridium sp. Marseille-P6806]|uniref:ATP-binding protein n=1 Tax=Lachnoclostridium sp. Marseille-P6806 TaxID=2364793 RepID=UPI00102F31EE|nr:ATP-binding protein [Lachnoclostridium sp. Marseille-P6806]